MSNLILWMTMYSLELAILAGILLIIWLLIHFGKEISLWFTNSIVYGLLGKARRLANEEPSINKGWGDKTWFSEELVVCGDYMTHYDKYAFSVGEYQRAKSYLVNADEADRTPIPILIGIILLIIVLIEAFGFSYVFSGKAVPGASENVQVYQAFGIAVFIAIAMLFLTDIAGTAAYRNRKINKIRAMHNNAMKRTNGKSVDLESTKPIVLETDAEDGPKDNEPGSGSPNYIRILNRTKDVPATVEPSYWQFWLVGFAILVVAAFSFAVRAYVYDEQKTQETVGVAPNSFYKNLPDLITAPQKAADDKAANEAADSGEKASLVTFVFLSIVFILIQVVSIWIGSNWGFIGVVSGPAYKLLQGFPTDSEYERWHRRKQDYVAKLGQSQVSTLQQRMGKRANKMGVNAGDSLRIENRSGRTFAAYIAAEIADRDKRGGDFSKPLRQPPEVAPSDGANVESRGNAPGAQAEKPGEGASPGEVKVSAERHQIGDRFQYLKADGTENNTMYSLEQLKQLRAAKKITNDTLVRRDGSEDFVPLSSLV